MADYVLSLIQSDSNVWVAAGLIVAALILESRGGR